MKKNYAVIDSLQMGDPHPNFLRPESYSSAADPHPNFLRPESYSSAADYML